ncbi:hypothetical protein [Pandoraea apista]|uniref:hypothetical protein n=1 Tax=Pandoraea apista TaxID=93218 RepID=UPI00058A9DE0|nr:hypothetical protein [Pandoraea apista]AJE99585.1 hypothetical protein SG18_17725 [Pandoraea apista]AKH73706.1 hypothetical protein XM39_17920 [Pandoraea apista]AKI62254.1 hypothetical protein AA956_11235 [Pandoraea apista]
MAKGKGKDIGMGRWSDAAIKRQWRLHRAGEASQKEDSTVRRPPEIAKREGYFLWSVRQAAFVGRHDGTINGGGRHFATCTAQAKRYVSEAQARAAGDVIAGDVLILYGYAVNTPLYVVGR